MAETKYKQTEIGLIPEEWEKKRVCDTCETVPVKLKLKTSDYLPIGKYPIIDQGQDYICGYTNIDEAMPAGEYILFGDHTCCVKYVDFPFVQGADGLKVLKTSDNSKFIYYLLCNIRIDVSYNRHWSVLKEMDILVPTSLTEQHAIASALTAIDNLIASLDKLIAKTQSVKQGAMQQLLTGKTRLKGFSEPWKEKKVCDTCETIPVKLKLKTSDYLPIGKYPIIDQGQDYICGYTNIDEAMPAGEYILFGDHTCCVKYVDFPFVQGADGLKVLKTSDNSKFIYYLLCNIRIDVSYNRHWSALKEMDILVPTSLPEQHRIASTLTAIDNQISALEAKRKKYEMVKVGMMHQLLTGKIKLK